MFDSKISKNRSCINKKAGKYLSHLAYVLTLILLIMPASSTLAAPSANEIANQVTNKFKSLTSVQATITLQYWKENGRADTLNNSACLFKANLKNKLLRAQITSGSYEGMILVWDQAKKTASVYHPVLNKVFDGTQDKVAKSGLGININDIDITSVMTFDIANLASIKHLRTEKLNRIDHYVIQISTKQSPTIFQDVWVDAETMLVSRVVSYYANGNKQGQVDITNFKENPTFSNTELTDMPKGVTRDKL